MRHPLTPRQYALVNLQELSRTWSGVHDGDTESIHDARVATRRIRAALPFVFAAPPKTAEELRRIGRALGRVRELDATYALLTALQDKVPDAAGAIAVLRRDMTEELSRQRRRMIKALDQSPRSIARAIEKGGRVARLSSIWRSWRHELRESITRRAADARAAIDHATAVYMPNRSHAARIEVKKLRYAAEVAVAAGLMSNVDALDRLKKVQSRLGALHDLHVLAQSIEGTQFPHNLSAPSLALASVVSAECVRIQGKYARSRDTVRDACDACVRALHDTSSAETRAVSAAAIVAVPVLVAWYLGDHGEERSEQTSAKRGPYALPAPTIDAPTRDVTESAITASTPAQPHLQNR
jgi:CHAD domain-containing protein